MASKLRVRQIESLDGSVTHKVADIISDISTTEVTTETGTQTLPDALNARAVKDPNPLVASEDTGFVDSPTADNTQAAIDLLLSVSDGDTVDFGGKVWRVHATVSGIASATATPGTDDAVPLTDVPRLIGLKNITIKNGGLYAANQGTAPEKSYFPSTIFFKDCEHVHFIDAVFEARGEDYGDADASQPLTFEERTDFVGQNGGHAIVMARCSHVTGNVLSRFCGSTASFYTPSCYDVRLVNCFSNPASLGYAGYNIDSWCGKAVDTGFPKHDLTLIDCSSFSEGQLTRREDGANAGSNIYCSKAGALTEDSDAILVVRGGSWGDSYGNAASDGEFLGAAFVSGSSHAEVSDVYIFNVAHLCATTASASFPGTIHVNNAYGNTSISIVANYPKSFASQKAIVSNSKIEVTGDRSLPFGDITKTAYVFNHVINIPCDVRFINCDFTGAEMVAKKRTGTVSYGKLIIEGGRYEVTERFCEVSGWGGSSLSDAFDGVTVKGGARIVDIGSSTTTFIDLSNTDGDAVVNYLYFDAKDSEFISGNNRSIGTVTNAGGTNLRIRVHYPQLLSGLYRTNEKGHPTTSTCFITENTGQAGDFAQLRIHSDSRYSLRTPCIIIGREGFVLEVASISSGPSYNATDDVVEAVYFVKGTLSTGTEYNLDDPYTAIH